MTPSVYPLQSAALSDVVFLVGLAPSSLAPISVAEMHLYAYLGNLVALNRGVPVSEWGYRFAVTIDGFPFAHELKNATDNLVRRSVVQIDDSRLYAGDDLLARELSVLGGLAQSTRRKGWLADAFSCALHLPRGAVREAINQSPGMATSLLRRRTSELLRRAEIDEIYDELTLVRQVLDSEVEDEIQPLVVWLSARVVSQGRS